MQNKLQELTDKLYQEGLSKGKAEAEQILSDAKDQAAKIIADAKAQAEDIIAKAAAQSESAASKLQSDTKVACTQSVAAAKQDIQNLILAKIVTEPTGKLLSDAEFLKTLITSVASAFSAEGAKDLEVVLPETLKDSLEAYVTTSLSKTVGAGVTASFSKKISGGFTIAPKDGGYFISLTDETFNELICEYLRPVTRKVLFG